MGGNSPSDPWHGRGIDFVEQFVQTFPWQGACIRLSTLIKKNSLSRR